MRHRDRLDQRAELAEVRDDRAADEHEAGWRAAYAEYADRYWTNLVVETTPGAVVNADGTLDWSTRTPPAAPSPDRWPADKRVTIRRNRITLQWLWAVGLGEHEMEYAHGVKPTWAEALDAGLTCHAEVHLSGPIEPTGADVWTGDDWATSVLQEWAESVIDPDGQP